MAARGAEAARQMLQLVEGQEIDENYRKTMKNIDKREVMSKYLSHVERIKRLKVALQLNGHGEPKKETKSAAGKRKYHQATTSAGFIIRKWKRELAASEKIVRNIQAKNFNV